MSETIGELKRTLKAHGLKVSGTRLQCQDRLNSHLLKRMLKELRIDIIGDEEE
tara:strand:+ start:1669 stop:1827 length:159 start_codon:yes stop_codon:yes gene_type:complete